MTRRFLAAALALAVVGRGMHAQDAAHPTVVIVVRHAEKAAAPADDPPLTDAGAARAKALATALADANVSAVITTQLRRTRETAAPLATLRGVVLETVPTSSPVAAHAKAVADAVRKHAGQTVLVVGHSNTVGAIIGALGGPRVRDLCDAEYSTLFTLVLDGTSARLVTSTFGAPSPDTAANCGAMK